MPEPQDRLLYFDYHQPTQAIADQMVIVRGNFARLARLLNDMLPESRAKSLAFTALEESSMRSIQALAVHAEGATRFEAAPME